MIVKPDTYFDATYDVIVLGFGGAGATAARFAADAGAKVLLVDSAPEGEEGGNTRVCYQLIASGNSLTGIRKFYSALSKPIKANKKVMDAFTEGLVNMPRYIKKYLGVIPYSSRKKETKMPFSVEYPELPGHESYDYLTVNKSFADGALWSNLRKQVLDRSDKIGVWYNSPAKHLIKGSDDKTIVGVQIEREHVLYNIKAKNGVVMATGGFEDNKQMIQDYLQEPSLQPTGGLYNTGIGILLANEAGAQLSHMRSYESIGQYHGLSPKQPEESRSKYPVHIFWANSFTGSVIVVGDDGSRYFKEDDINRHGHIYNHGFWRVPLSQVHPAVVLDQKKYNEFKKDHDIAQGYPGFVDSALKAKTLSNLAKKINVNPDKLKQTVSEFNFFAKNKYDYAYHRDPKTLRAFDTGPYYAIPLRQNMLNTQGGAKRNERTEVINTYNNPIPHLYEAGELGSPFVNQYVGGGNIADGLISGKIAGQNAAHPKDDHLNQGSFSEKMPKVPRFQSQNQTASNIAWGNTKENFSTDKNQYIGRSNSGMGDEIVVRITVGIGNSLKQVEVLKESESKDYGLKAIQKLPDKMVKQNTYKVDSISGATVSSRGLKDAVKDAINQIPTVQKD